MGPCTRCIRRCRGGRRCVVHCLVRVVLLLRVLLELVRVITGVCWLEGHPGGSVVGLETTATTTTGYAAGGGVSWHGG